MSSGKQCVVAKIMPGSEIKLSVVLQIGDRRARAERCLASLLGQELPCGMEILLFDYSAGSHAPIAGADHPMVITTVKDRLEPIGESRAEAVRAARGDIVAFIEEHCVALPSWAGSIVSAHACGWAGVGGEVHTGNPGVGISDLIALMNNSRWLPPAQPREADLMIGHNSSYSRQALLSYHYQLDLLLRCDVVLQWKMKRDGHGLFVDPQVKLSHFNETTIGDIMRGYFLWNRMFAPTRAQVFEWTTARRLLWILLMPLVPAVRTFKLWLQIRRRYANRLGTYFRGLPFIILAQSAGALGQAAGLLFGVGGAETDFLHYELTLDRPELPSSGADLG